MSLQSQAELSQDQDFIDRVAACAATQDLPEGWNPVSWAQMNAWEVSSAPGFGDAYESAIVTLRAAEHPGSNPAVITDNQILSAVQAVLAQGAV